jgi:hypothetical protein
MNRFNVTLPLLIVVMYALCIASPVIGAVSEVHFTLEKGHLIVPAKIKGNVPVEVVLATGSEHSIINDSLLEKYNLSAFYSGEGIITGGSLDRTYSFTPVSNVYVGDTKIADLQLRLGSEAAATISKSVGREIFAIIGADFFKGRVVQFDFKRSVVRFLSDVEADLLKDKKGGTTAERAVLRMGLVKERVTLPVVENVTFNGKKIKTLFDTGARTVVSLTPSAAKQVGLSAPPAKGEPRTDKVGSLRFGEVELSDVPVTLYAKDSVFDQESDGFGAVAGIALLQNFIVTFDYRSEVVILEHI